MYIVAGSKKGRMIMAPKGSATRPTAGALREALFNICQSYIQDAHFLDLFAGSGAIGLEALSRGAKSCTFVDNSKDSIMAIKKNVQALEFSLQASIVQADALTFLKGCERRKVNFDIIFVDPPYAQEDLSMQHNSYQVMQIVDNSAVLAVGGFLFIEDVGQKKELLPNLSSLQLVSSRRAGRAILNQFQKIAVSRS